MTIDDELLTPSFFADPYPVYARMRDQGPVYWSERLRRLVVVHYRECEAGLRDPRWSKQMVPALMENRPESARAELAPMVNALSRQMLFADPPDHTRLRSLVNKAFTPRTVEGLRSRIAEITGRLLDQVAGRGEMDVIRDFAYPLPATVICEMLGIPLEQRDQFKRWSDDVAAWIGNMEGDPEIDRRTQRSLAEAGDYFAAFGAELRENPRDDLMSALVHAEEDGDGLSLEELMANAMLLLAAGHETTTNLIGNGLLALLRNPEQLQRLRQDPQLAGTAVEEFLRYDSPAQLVARLAVTEMEVAGQALPPGTVVGYLLGAANRDPRQFENADQLDVGRQNNKHLSFAHGIHFCLGAALARAEGEIALTAILDRLGNLQLAAAEVRFAPNFTLRGLESLPVIW